MILFYCVLLMANYNNNKFSWKDSSSSFKNNNAFPQQNTFNTTGFQQQPVSSTPLFNNTQQPTQQPTQFQSVFNNQQQPHQQPQQQPQQQTSLFNPQQQPQQQTNFFQQQQQQPVVVPQNSGSRSAQIESKIDILTTMVQELKNKTPVSSSNSIHSGIHCDMCKKQNIIGLRYKCVVCPDYDLCEECWNTKRKEHTLHVQKLWCIVEDPVNNLTITGTCG